VQPIDAADVIAAEAFKEEKLRRVHNTIQDVISLVPTGTSELFPGIQLLVLSVMLKLKLKFR
jgi:hypothetical protein